MQYNHIMIDTDQMPEEIREAIIMIAAKHNAIPAILNDHKQDLDGISGVEPGDKQDFYHFTPYARRIGQFLHSIKFNVSLTVINLVLVLVGLRVLGVPTQELGQFVMELLRHHLLQ